MGMNLEGHGPSRSAGYPGSQDNRFFRGDLYRLRKDEVQQGWPRRFDANNFHPS